MLAVLITVSGRVQGVGFRWWVAGLARQLQLAGQSSNLLDGRVEIFAQGEPEKVRRLLRYVIEEPTTRSRPGRVDDYDLEWPDPTPGRYGFNSY